MMKTRYKMRYKMHYEMQVTNCPNRGTIKKKHLSADSKCLRKKKTVSEIILLKMRKDN